IDRRRSRSCSERGFRSRASRSRSTARSSALYFRNRSTSSRAESTSEKLSGSVSEICRFVAAKSGHERSKQIQKDTRDNGGNADKTRLPTDRSGLPMFQIHIHYGRQFNII